MKASKFWRILLATVMALSLAFVMFGCDNKPKEEATDEPAATEETEVTAEPVELQIFAANSLEKALPEVQALYTAANPEVTFAETQFKGSGDLVTELQGGAPADIFISASKSTMDDAVANGNIDEATRKDMFGNDLVIVAATGSDIQISSLEDVNTDAITKIAIGESASVPAGAYANQSLNTLGLYSSDTGKDGTYDAGFESKLVFQSSVGNVAKTVESGDCQIGFVYSSDVYRYTGIEIIFTVPADTHKAIVYPGAVVADSANAEAAQAFLDFCSTDPEAQAIWSKYGFEVK